VLRQLLALIQATLRTNFWRTGVGHTGAPGPRRSFLSFKFDSAKVPGLPEPKPLYEIFVYSPRFEGIHLRGGKVARGGLRWSDRPEDFRTEVLGLVKAQMVKNTVIVPVGSKGGFVLKKAPPQSDRDAYMKEGVACYQDYLRALLDLTDNLAGPQSCRRRRWCGIDGDDPYLVVAADKGTATFSDYANAISKEYGHWLGDAFASGGSAGYDHKGMAITARGAWESVKRFFREQGIDTQTTPFTVVGIGDMSGDVFGNGMLLSRHIRLVAAFDHRHVLIDPNPDPVTSFAERERLFKLPRSSWADYDAKLISDGGGIWARSEKSIPISPQTRAALGIAAERLTPTELLSAILKAPSTCSTTAASAPTSRRAPRATPTSATAPTTRCASTAASCAARSRPKAATSASPSAGASRRHSAACASTPTRSTTRPASIPRTTKSTSRSCSASRSATAR
jgi:glutamate dehydrogenase